MSEEEKEAIETLETEGTENNYLEVKILLNLVEKQQEEIEEKTTIIMAGAEKVKQLEKGNRSLMESRIKWKNRYYKEKAKNKECISKDKIREWIDRFELEEDLQDKYDELLGSDAIYKFLKKLLEEK